jgi:hypothetical protein
MIAETHLPTLDDQELTTVVAGLGWLLRWRWPMSEFDALSYARLALARAVYTSGKRARAFERVSKEYERQADLPWGARGLEREPEWPR